MLGDMLELGKRSPDLHYEVGQAVSQLKPERLITVGNESERIRSGAIDGGLEESHCAHFGNAASATPPSERIVPILIWTRPLGKLLSKVHEMDRCHLASSNSLLQVLKRWPLLPHVLYWRRQIL